MRLELQSDCSAGVWVNHATTALGPDGRPTQCDTFGADDLG